MASFTSRAANQKLTFTQTITHQPAFLNSSNSNEQEVEEKEREENEKERDHKRGFVIQRESGAEDHERRCDLRKKKKKAATAQADSWEFNLPLTGPSVLLPPRPLLLCCV